MDPKVYCALDTTDFDKALAIAQSVTPHGCGLKIGLEFFNGHGPEGVRKIQESCKDVPIFLDLKYHDIPHTVKGAIKAISSLNVAYLNLHASGGMEMMKAAREACAPETKLLGVTVLTSLNEENLNSIGQQTPIEYQVKRLAELSQLSGLDGVVCPSHEITMLRKTCGSDFILMVPGIRPEGSNKNDQKRVMAPEQAIEAGANHLVIGRPITEAKDPGKAAEKIIKSLS